MPFTVPEKWKWVRVSDVACINPKVIATDSNINVFFIPMAAVSAGYLNKISLEEDRPWETVKNGYTKFANGDVLIAKITPCFQNRKSAIANNLTSGTGCGSSEFHVLRSNASILDREYLLLFVKSAWFIAYGIENFKGTAGQQRLGTTELKNCRFPLPPISEQRRIVAKTKKLFEQIDRAEKAYKELSGPLSERFRQLCLEKAIQGKLVPQLVSEPEVKQIGEVPKDIPFAIPEKWSWIRLGELVNYGSSKQIEGFKITASTWVLDLEDVEKNSGKLLQKKYGTKTTSNKSCFKKGDVLYGKLRPYLNKVLIADEDGCCTTEIIPISVSSAKLKLDAEFLCYFLRSPYFIEYANSCAYGVKMPRLGTKDAKAALVPIPPFQEQQRIVRRLKQLFTLITDLE